MQDRDETIVRRVLRWSWRIAGALFAILLLAAAIAAMRETLAERADVKRFPERGRRIDVGGYSLNLNCTGQGNPTVILESGWSMPAVSWSLVQPDIAKFTRVCSYDRAGYGWSDEGPEPRTSEEMAKELHALLHNAAISPPYILSAHSLGGYVARCFRAIYPNEVVGMVLIDSSQEDMVGMMPQDLRRRVQGQTDGMRRMRPLAPLLSHLGVMRRVVYEQQQDFMLPPDLLEQVVFLSAQPKAVRTMVAELDAGMRDDQDAQEVRQSGSSPGSLGAMPLVVLTAAVDQTLSGEVLRFETRFVNDLQLRLAHLSIRGRQVIVSSSHFIPFENPKVVVNAIREVYGEANASR